jgi:hypothetical protein
MVMTSTLAGKKGWCLVYSRHAIPIWSISGEPAQIDAVRIILACYFGRRKKFSKKIMTTYMATQELKNSCKFLRTPMTFQ